MNLEAQFLLAAGSALVSAAFSAGMAWMSIKMIGSKVDDLRSDVREVRDETAVHSTRIEMHDGDIKVLKSQVGSLREMRKVPWPQRNNDGGGQS